MENIKRYVVSFRGDTVDSLFRDQEKEKRESVGKSYENEVSLAIERVYKELIKVMIEHPEMQISEISFKKESLYPLDTEGSDNRNFRKYVFERAIAKVEQDIEMERALAKAFSMKTGNAETDLGNRSTDVEISIT